MKSNGLSWNKESEVHWSNKYILTSSLQKIDLYFCFMGTNIEAKVVRGDDKKTDI